MSSCFVDVVRSASGNSHAVFVELRDVTNFFGMFFRIKGLSVEIRSPFDAHYLMSGSCSAVINSYTFAVGKILAAVGFEGAAVVSFATEVVTCFWLRHY